MRKWEQVLSLVTTVALLLVSTAIIDNYERNRMSDNNTAALELMEDPEFREFLAKQALEVYQSAQVQPLSLEPTVPAQTVSGVREYIGARYVPVFADPVEWDNTRAYEQLTIVLYQGNSYTSAQSVPIGVDITNTQYWLQTGNYSAQVEAYRQEVLAFDGRITTVENKVNGGLLVMGDSWVNPNWSGSVDWWTPLGNMLEVDQVYNYGDGGALLGSNSTDTASSVMAQCNKAISEITSDLKYIVIVAGVNDGATDSMAVSAINTNIANMQIKLQSKWPGAKIMFFQNQCLYDPSSTVSVQRLKSIFRNYHAIQMSAKNSGANYSMNLVWAMWNQGLYQTDLLHPSNAAIRTISQCIFSTLTGTYESSILYRLTLPEAGNIVLRGTNGDIKVVGYNLPLNTSQTSLLNTGVVPVTIFYYMVWSQEFSVNFLAYSTTGNLAGYVLISESISLIPHITATSGTINYTN